MVSGDRRPRDRPRRRRAIPDRRSVSFDVEAAISEATEATGVYSVVDGSGSADPEDMTIAAPVPADGRGADPICRCANRRDLDPGASDSTTSATAATQVAPAATAALRRHRALPAPTGTTVVLKRNQFAVVGGLLVRARPGCRRAGDRRVAAARDGDHGAARQPRRRSSFRPRPPRPIPLAASAAASAHSRAARHDDANASAARDCSAAACHSGGSCTSESADQNQPARCRARRPNL